MKWGKGGWKLGNTFTWLQFLSSALEVPSATWKERGEEKQPGHNLKKHKNKLKIKKTTTLPPSKKTRQKFLVT